MLEAGLQKQFTKFSAGFASAVPPAKPFKTYEAAMLWPSFKKKPWASVSRSSVFDVLNLATRIL